MSYHFVYNIKIIAKLALVIQKNEGECAFVHSQEAREPCLSNEYPCFIMAEGKFYLSCMYLPFYEFVYLSIYTAELGALLDIE